MPSLTCDFIAIGAIVRAGVPSCGESLPVAP